MYLLLSLINITKSSSNALAVVATVLSAGGGRKRERESRRRRVVVVLEGQLIFCFGFLLFFFFFHFSRTIKISVLHACLTHTVRRPPPLFPLCVPPVVKSISLSLSL